MSDRHLLDEWLTVFFRQPVNTQSTTSLKQDVWRHIRIAESEERPANWFEQLLYTILAPQRQFATAAVILFLGIGFGFAAPDYQSANAASLPAKALGLEIYSSSYVHPFNTAQLGSP